jgi:poly(beta-D-mannuronate) lyase
MDTWISHASYIMIAADEHLRLPDTHARKAELANCVLEHLHQVAARNLFTEPRDSYSDNQGEYERNWMLASFNISFNKIRREPSLPADRIARVQSWLTTGGLIVMDKFNRHIDGRPQNRNANIYWAGVTLMATGINASNSVLYNRGVEFVRMGLDQIQANGVLPLEMNMGADAFRSHIFALQGLLFAAQIAKLNNLDLFSYQNNALMRLSQLAINSFRDFNNFQSLTTVTQTYLPAMILTTNKWDLTWMEIHFAHTGDVELIPYLSTLRPLRNHRQGNTTISYGLRCLAAGI